MKASSSRIEGDKGKDKVGFSGGGSPVASFEIIDEGAQNSSGRQPRRSEF